MIMSDQFIRELPAILAISFIFGGTTVYCIINSIATNWRKARVAEQNAVLKKTMIDHGFSADEIERVIKADANPSSKKKKPSLENSHV